MEDRIKVGSDIEFIRYLKGHGGDTMKKCYQCATCSVSCQLSPVESTFPRKEMLRACWGMSDSLVTDPDIWLCHGCMDCSQQCPRGAKPADLMAALRAFVFRVYSVPKFMGNALSSPKYLPALFIVAILFIGLLVISTNGLFHGFDLKFNHVDSGRLDISSFTAEGLSFQSAEDEHEFNKKEGIISFDYYKERGGKLSKEEFTGKYGIIQYDGFIAKILIQALFIPGNFLIFFLAWLGLSRYWKDLKRNMPKKPKYGFFRASFEVLLDFLLHRKFESCPTNSNRRWGHLYVFYGFLGTFIATGIVVLGELYEYGVLPVDLFNFPYPLGILHPVKVLGMISGIFLFLGLLLFFIKRIRTAANEGKSTYNDWLFLWILLGVAFTGIGTVLIRLPYNPTLTHWLVGTANLIYFIHLTLVFFLLWYMPYSKFAHMIYRFVGLVHLKMTDRQNKAEIFIN